ncbi:hypothetical protein Ahy_A07g032210 isoform C [Arachis hypogaea]|uniref:Uncharacterized protein n=1 Tax=Arachis hypogaea TaxID=3818 RepID=A0A445C6G5_ARAHY|nr:hypothetical protein Ahy_A07g032210 isoform C [Arachis hypogaea]
MWVLTVCVLGLDIVQVNVNRFGPTLCCGSSLPLLLGLCKDDASKLNNKISSLLSSSTSSKASSSPYTTSSHGSTTPHHHAALLRRNDAAALLRRTTASLCSSASLLAAAFLCSASPLLLVPPLLHPSLLDSLSLITIGRLLAIRVPNPHCQEQNTRLKLMQLGSIFLLKKAPSVMEDLCERYFGPLFELLSHDKLGAPEIVPDYPILSVDDLADQIAENKILHSHLEALHIRKAKKERNAASISFGSSSADTFGDAGLQTVMTCLRNSKEIVNTCHCKFVSPVYLYIHFKFSTFTVRNRSVSFDIISSKF